MACQQETQVLAAILAELKAKGWTVRRKRVARLMRPAGLRDVSCRIVGWAMAPHPRTANGHRSTPTHLD